MRREYIQLKVLPGNKQDVMNGRHNAHTTSQLPHSSLPQGDKEITKVLRNHSCIQSPVHQSIQHMSKIWKVYTCVTGKLPLQILKVGLWFQKVVLCLGHRQMPKLSFDVHFPLSKMPSHNILCDIPRGKLWPHLFHGKVSDTECKLKRDHPCYAQVQGQLEPSGVILLYILERGFTLKRLPVNATYW